MERVDPYRMYRPAELAALLGVHKITLYKWMASGHLPRPIKLGPQVTAFAHTDIEKWLKERRRETARADEALHRKGNKRHE